MRLAFLLLFLNILFIANALDAQPSGLDIPHKAIGKQLKKLGCSKKFQLSPVSDSSTYNIDETDLEHFYSITDHGCDTVAAYLYVGRVHTCRSGGCLVHYGQSGGAQFEFFDYFIIFSESFRVQSVKVFRYEATHGHEITAKFWLKQFKGYTGNHDLVVGKDIDAITGATTSVYNITYNIQEKTRELKRLVLGD